MDYSTLITSEHQQPNFLSIVSGLTNPLGVTQSDLLAMDLSINTAIGWQLDLIGEWVGVNRSVLLQGDLRTLNDDQYRTYLSMQIIANAWDGTKESAYKALASLNLYTVGDLKIIDNLDMSFVFCLQYTALDGFLIELILNGIIPLRPLGVDMAACSALNGSSYIGIGLYSTEMVTLF